MQLLTSLELRFGRFAIPGLVRFIVILMAAVWIIVQVQPGFIQTLTLDPVAVKAGEVWRLFTFALIPPTRSLFVIFFLLLTWTIGDGLEHAWGSFRLNIFILLGLLGTAVAAFFFEADAIGYFLHLSLFCAFATLYPDYPITLFVIVVKIKWLALISVALVVLNFVGGSWSMRLTILVTLTNYLIFFGGHWLAVARDRRYVDQRRAAFIKAKRETQLEAAAEGLPEGAMHRCKVCERTDLTDPQLDFRVASADDEEYCSEHLPKRAL